MNARTSSTAPVAVIGAGPIGLAAAAHLVQRGCRWCCSRPATASPRTSDSYRHVRLFSPWRYNIDRAARAPARRRRLEAPDDDLLPTAGEMVDQLPRAARAHAAHRTAFRFRTACVAISRDGFDKVKTAGREEAAVRAAGADGRRRARRVAPGP